jgi:hypothetical protein
MIYHVEGKRPFDFQDGYHLTLNKDLRDYLRENHAKPVTQQEYIDIVGPMRRESRARSHRAPAYARREYKRLVERYGFFPGGQSE